MPTSLFCVSPRTKRLLLAKGQRPLVLVAIPQPSHVEEAIEEIGDIIFIMTGTEPLIDTCSVGRRVLICAYGFFNPCTIFSKIELQVPAYVTRLYPVCCHMGYFKLDLAYIITVIDKLVKTGEVGLAVSVEDRESEKRIEQELKKMLYRRRYSVKYRAPIYINILSITKHYFIVSLISRNIEKTSYWRKKILNSSD